MTACREAADEHARVERVALHAHAITEERAARVGVRVRVPRPGLCTDNGAMVAALGSEMVSRGRASSALDLPADSSMPVEVVLV